MDIDEELVLSEEIEVIAKAMLEGSASVVLALPEPEHEPEDDSIFVTPDERVIAVCDVIKSVAEVMPSVPEHCKSALDELTGDSQVAGVFRQKDVWFCVALSASSQVEIHAVMVPQS